MDWLTSICNRIVKEEAIPESWQMSGLRLSDIKIGMD